MFEFLLNILNDFINFLKSRNIINAGIAFVIAIQINKLFTDIINLIVNPIASKMINEELSKKEYIVFGIDFKTGQLFLSFLNFIFIMIFVYYIFKLTEDAPNFFNKIYSTFTNIFKKS